MLKFEPLSAVFTKNWALFLDFQHFFVLSKKFTHT